MKAEKVVTRFAPSPTGLLHAGNYRTALFAYLYARKHEGVFGLRIEDTDKARSKKEYEDNIIESLAWLGLKYDNFTRQSERTSIHAQAIQKLIDSGHAYVSKEENVAVNTDESGSGAPANSQATQTRRSEVIRFKNPKKKVKFKDKIRGEIEFDTTDLGDFVIARSMTEPVFHLVVVVDDNDSGVTLIIRGEDHISNTPRHILLYEALGYKVPEYAHLPLLLSPDRSKLSKRKGALPITAYRDKGYLKEAVINYMALLGWSPSAGIKSGASNADGITSDRELYSLDELVNIFDISQVQKSGAVFDETKLNWMNKEYIALMNDIEFKDYISPYIPELKVKLNESTEKILFKLIKDRIHYSSEVAELFGAGPKGEFNFLTADLSYDPAQLVWKKNSSKEEAIEHLSFVKNTLEKSNSEEFTNIKYLLMPYAEAKGKGNVLWPLRYSLSGKEKSPDPFTLLEILGRDESIKRISHAVTLLQNNK